jgi:predicted alpha/beta superfamily hydrolase
MMIERGDLEHGAHPATDLPTRSPAVIMGAEQWDQASKATDRRYRVLVSRPPGPAPADGYPVVFLTDGNAMFPCAAFASSRMLNGEIRPAVIVGVGWHVEDSAAFMTERTYQLTPPTPDDYTGLGMVSPPYGGAEGLLNFILDELVPALEQIYPVNRSDLSLFGDSLGGLFVLRTLFTRPDAFRSYVVASPSIWWNDRSVLADEASFASSVRAGISPRVLITVGGLEQSIDDLKQPPKALNPNWSQENSERSIQGARMVDNAAELAGRLADLAGDTDLEVEFVVFEGETHLSVVPANVSRAISFALRP